ncbi:MAG: DNA methyltransferase [Clostridiales bacterium]|nr:DNA methyltransferase [Clostridiales bacterium]
MEKKYNIIYADPPWQYRSGAVQGAAKNHYPTMSDDELYHLPVGEMADEEAVLFLWATFPKLPEAFRLIESWGFRYKTVAFVWVKQNPSGNGFFLGLGWWTRGNAEICLLATKGKPRRKSAKISQLVISPRMEHSRKPEQVRELIVELAGDLPRIELFARQKTDGWDVWGNEVPCDIEMKGCEGNGLCSGSERSDQSENEGHVQSDKEAADLL